MKLSREILRLAIPSILANITVPLVGMVDIAVVGHLPVSSSATLIGGISIGTMLFDLLYWNLAFLRAGTGGLTAQAYGRGEDTGGILARALRLALLSGLALIGLQWAVTWLAFLLVDCTPEVQALATQYFHIRIWAAPATLSLFAYKGWFIGLQDSVRPMTADLLVNGVNILLSIVLGLRMGFVGVAIGTAAAQWCGFLYCTLAARRRLSIGRKSLILSSLIFSLSVDQPKEKKLSDSSTDSYTTSDFFTLNRDLFLRSVGMIAVYIGFTVLSARYGDLMLAVSAILMKLLMIFSYFTDGFAYAGEALAGKFIGQGRADGLRASIRQTFAWSGGVGFFAVWLCGLALFGGRSVAPETAIHILMAAYFTHLAVRTIYLTARKSVVHI